MEFDIDVLNKVKKENINKYHYTLSLLKEGYRVGALDKKRFIYIQSQIMNLLKKIILKYTKKLSTSVKTETANQIYQSILYALDMALSQVQNPDESIHILYTREIEEIYKEGIQGIESLFEESKGLFETIKEEKLNVPLKIYNFSIDVAIPLFIKEYDIKYSAQDTKTLLDYPLIFDDMKYQGVVYINHYLVHLKLETDFIHYFNIKDVNKLLNNFGKTHQIDIEEAYFNIFEIVFNNSIFSVILRDDFSNILLSYSEYKTLKEMFVQSNEEELDTVITQATDNLIQGLDIKDDPLINYILEYKNTLFIRLKNAVKNNGLEYLVISEKNDILEETISFQSETGMTDHEFRILIDYIKECEDIKEKILAIKTNIKSLTDMIDLLSSDCLFGNEYVALYHELSNFELAVLTKIVFYEELRDDSFTLDNIKRKETQHKCEEQFIDFINKLNKNRRNEIYNLLNNKNIKQ